MTAPRLLFVNHVSTMSGAEFVLAQVAEAFPQASAFLFENGPLVDALKSRGLQTIISKDGAGLSEIRRDQSLLRAIPVAGRLVRLVWEIARTARSQDVLYANSQKAFLLTALAASVVRRPLIWHLHDILDGAHFGGAQRKLQIGLANRVATRVVVPSTACADAFVGAGGNEALLEVIPNGIAAAQLEPRSRSDLGLASGPLVGVFSRLAKWKGQHVVVEALRQTPGVSAILVGSALFGEDAYERELREMVTRLGLEDRVRFLGQRNDVLQLMTAVDCVVHPSTYPEPFGLTIVEAMTVGTPVIASDAGAAREILDDGKAGQLLPAGDPTALASRIQTFFSKPGGFEEQTLHAAERAKELYTADRMRRSLHDLVERIAARPGG